MTLIKFVDVAESVVDYRAVIIAVISLDTEELPLVEYILLDLGEISARGVFVPSGEKTIFRKI